MIGRAIEWLVLRVLALWCPARYRLSPREGDGVPLLRQFKIFSFGKEHPRGVPPWYHVSCYLQSFVNPERPERMHIHRWRYMRSFVLSGAFGEEQALTFYASRRVAHRAPSTYAMNDNVVHRLAWVAPRTWTLFFMFGKARHNLPGGWGYFERDGSYTPWNELIDARSRVKAL